MWKLAYLTVGIATGLVCTMVYNAKLRDSKWIAEMEQRFKRKEKEPSRVWRDVK